LRHRCDLGIFGGGVKLGMEELWEEIRGSRYNINAPKDMRDLQKQDLMKKSRLSVTDDIGL
jgi:hypothetical protein